MRATQLYATSYATATNTQTSTPRLTAAHLRMLCGNVRGLSRKCVCERTRTRRETASNLVPAPWNSRPSFSICVF